MRLRDFAIIVMILGIATSIFVTMIQDENLEEIYGTATAHSEDDFSNISSSLIKASNQSRDKSVELQNALQDESDVSLFSLGADTFNVVKSSLSFEYLDALNAVFFEIEHRYGLPAEIGATMFAILVVIIVFTIVGAFLRWRT
jgi:hypothetical protein